MMENTTNNEASDFKVPEQGQWPGAMGSFRLVKPVIKPQFWNILSAVGLGIVFVLLFEIVFGIIFKHNILGIVLDEVAGIAGGAFIDVVIITIYFAALRKQVVSLSEAINSGLNRLLSMMGLLIVMDIIFAVSFILLIVPFFIILPRVYLAPYFLIMDNCTVNEALSSSWHKTRGYSNKVYGIILLNLALALLCITLIGIPFAIYWGIINTSSFAVLAMYLSANNGQDKQDPGKKLKSLTKDVE